MTDEEIRQQALNKVGIEVLENLETNIAQIKQDVKLGNSNISYMEIDMIVQSLGSRNDRISVEQGCKMNRCSKYEFLKLVKQGIVRKLKPIKEVFSKRDLQIAIYEAEIKRKQERLNRKK